jgi:hypothetical protein
MKRATAKSRVGPGLTLARAELGICCTCNYSPNCVNLKAAGQPIWYCDQFDTHVPRRELTLLEVLGEVEASKAHSVAPEAQGGLCSDCGSSADCVNQVPGVKKVYCEGYC